MSLLKMELLQHTSKLQILNAHVNENCVIRLHPFSGASMVRQKKCRGVLCLSNLMPLNLSRAKAVRLPLMGASSNSSRVNVSKVEELLKLGYEDDDDEEETEKNDHKSIPEDSFVMDEEEQKEWRRKIREVMSRVPDDEDVEEEEETDLLEQRKKMQKLLEKRKKMQKLLAEYPLVVEEEDPDWPEDADGWGFNMGQFFNKISIKNVKKDDDEDYDSENEIVWKDDDYIRPIRDLSTAEWEEAIFKDFSSLVVLVHNRYKRPKVNEKVRDELEKAVNIIWNCRLPSPRCVAIDANCELDLVSALRVSIFPQLIFTKVGKILRREKAIRSADELSKIMAFFYFGAAKLPCLMGIKNIEEAIPTVQNQK